MSAVTTKAPAPTPEFMPGWKEGRTKETTYWTALLKSERKGGFPHVDTLEAALDTVVNYLLDASRILEGVGWAVFAETNKDGTHAKVDFGQIGVLLGELDECKKFARQIVEEAEKVGQSTLRDLFEIAQNGELGSEPIFDEYGFRN